MNSTSTAVIVVAFMAAVAVGVLIMGGPDESSAETPLGLSSTKTTLEIGDTFDLEVWSLPSGTTYSNIGWSSDDESVATVTAGTITAVGAGTATVTAKVNKDGVSYTDTCRVTVTSDPVTRPLTVYDPFSEKYDSAVLSGEGFVGDDEKGGVLGRTFNRGGYVIISAAGSIYSWQGNLNSLNVTVYNFSKIVMTIKVGVTSYSAEYVPSAAVDESTFVTQDGITYNQTAQSPSLYVKGLGYGTYTVTFTVYDNVYHPKVVTTGTFAYSEGDGRYDTSSEYTRSYVWYCTIENNQQFCSLKMTYSYAEYWGAMMRSNEGLFHYKNGIASAQYEKDCVNFIDTGKSVTDLEAGLREVFESNYSAHADDENWYAQFLFSFVQIRFFYESDFTLYYDCDSNHSSGTDVWAYPDMTLYTGLGDCEDTSLLLSSLFKRAGYDTALVILPSHMMSALKLTGYSYEDSFQLGGEKYYLCETTANSGVRMGYCSTSYLYKEFTYFIV